jgi:hypothetical protein
LGAARQRVKKSLAEFEKAFQVWPLVVSIAVTTGAT